LAIERFNLRGKKSRLAIDGFDQDMQQLFGSQFKTVAAIRHYGEGKATDGHYTALIRLSTNEWVEANDAKISDPITFPSDLIDITCLCLEKVS
jgi:hypothetical protein